MGNKRVWNWDMSEAMYNALQEKSSNTHWTSADDDHVYGQMCSAPYCVKFVTYCRDYNGIGYIDALLYVMDTDYGTQLINYDGDLDDNGLFLEIAGGKPQVL